MHCLGLQSVLKSCLSASIFCPERARRAARNSWVGFCPSGKKEPSMTTNCWINCHKSCVSSHNRNCYRLNMVVKEYALLIYMFVYTWMDSEAVNMQCLYTLFVHKNMSTCGFHQVFFSCKSQLERRSQRKGHMRRSNQRMRALPPRAPLLSPHRCCS